MKFYTPLRYPGGKGKLSYYIQSVIDANNLYDGHYIEPYAGGAGVALELLSKEYVKEIHINDIDIAIYSFWHAVKHHNTELCELISSTDVTIEEWQKQKEVMNKEHSKQSIELAFATFFLNRTNRSGILKAGVIGGKAQSGKWKLDARYNKSNLIDRISRIAKYSSRINVYNEDTASLLSRVPDIAPSNSLLYLDPPYFVKGQGLYRNFYDYDDHVKIREKLDNLRKTPWLVSYDNAPEIREIYTGYKQRSFDLQYSAQTKKLGSEVMIFSDNLIIPELQLGKFAS